jgi:hypothetical protein
MPYPNATGAGELQCADDLSVLAQAALGGIRLSSVLRAGHQKGTLRQDVALLTKHVHKIRPSPPQPYCACSCLTASPPASAPGSGLTTAVIINSITHFSTSTSCCGSSPVRSITSPTSCTRGRRRPLPARRRPARRRPAPAPRRPAPAPRLHLRPRSPRGPRARFSRLLVASTQHEWVNARAAQAPARVGHQPLAPHPPSASASRQPAARGVHNRTKPRAQLPTQLGDWLNGWKPCGRALGLSNTMTASPTAIFSTGRSCGGSARAIKAGCGRCGRCRQPSARVQAAARRLKPLVPPPPACQSAAQVAGSTHLEGGEHAVGAQVGHVRRQAGEQAHHNLVARLLGDLLGSGGHGDLRGRGARRRAGGGTSRQAAEGSARRGPRGAQPAPVRVGWRSCAPACTRAGRCRRGGSR